MARAAIHRSWYRIALGNGQIVAASGEHLGQAIAAAEHHAKSFAVAVAQADATPLGESVGKEAVVATDERGPATTFQPPPGVLPAIGNALALRRGWIERPSDALFVIEAQTDAAHLVDLYLGLVERVPSADNLEIRVLPHFEDTGTTDVWLTSRVNAQKILRFLDDRDEELFGNGHLEISVYVRSAKATLRLTEHKTVAWIADDRALAGDVARWLKELAVPQVDHTAPPFGGAAARGQAPVVDALPTVAGVPHFHFRGAKSRDRKKLGEELFRQRLRRVAKEPAARDTAG